MGKASVDVAPAHAFMVVASSATVPSLAIKLTSSLHPPANTNTPASIASWIAGCAASFTTGPSSSGIWSIAPRSNEIRYRVIA
jgi:hypothetical protein